MPANGNYPQANTTTGTELIFAAQYQNGPAPLPPITVNIQAFQIVPKMPLASLPAVTSKEQGWWSYVTDGRNPNEGAGAGTGCLCSVNSAGVWAAMWSGVQVTN